MEDIRLEKTLEAVYDDIVQTVPIRSRKRCHALLTMAMLLDQMMHETNRQIAIDTGIVGSCEECMGFIRRDSLSA